MQSAGLKGHMQIKNYFNEIKNVRQKSATKRIKQVQVLPYGQKLKCKILTNSRRAQLRDQRGCGYYLLRTFNFSKYR